MDNPPEPTQPSEFEKQLWAEFVEKGQFIYRHIEGMSDDVATATVHSLHRCARQRMLDEGISGQERNAITHTFDYFSRTYEV